MLQRACACGGECESCKKKKLQRRAAGPGPDTIPESVHRTIGRSGSPLPRATRGMFEAVLGHDFSGVRVHADAASAASAHDVNARAYTVGQNIVFGSGEYRPGTAAGDHLLAHELTHVVQQSGSGGTLQRQGLDDREEDEKEREAESLADRATSLHDSDPDKEIAASRTGAERLDPAPPPDDYEVHAKVVQIPDPRSDEWGTAQSCILQLHGDEIQSMAAALNLALTRRVNLTMIVRDPAEYMEMAKGRFGNWKDSLRYIAVGPKGSTSDVCWADANRMFPDNEGSNELTTARLFYGRKPCSPKAQDKLKEFRNKVTEALGNCTNSRKTGTAGNQDVKERLPVLSMHNNGLGSGDVSFGGWKNSAMTDVAYAGGRGFGGNMRSGDNDIVLVTSAATYESFSGLLILESAERCMPAGEPDRLFPGFSDLLNKKRSSRDRRLASVFDPTLSAPKSPVQETDSDAEITLIHEVARGLVAGLDTGRYDTQVPNPADRARIVANVRGADEVVGRFNVVLQSIFKSDVPADQSLRKENSISGHVGRTTLPKDGSSSVTYRRTNFLNLEIGLDRRMLPSGKT
jgi:hypothetical protein